MSTDFNNIDLGGELEGSESGLSRRSLVRAGANAAWAVPLISIATSAPALAVSAAPALTINQSGVSRFNDTLVVTAQVTNFGTKATSSPLSLVLTMSQGTGEYAKRPIRGSHTGLGWRNPVPGGPATPGGPWTWTFLNTAKLNPNASTTVLKFFLGVGKNGLLSLTGTHPPQPRTGGGAHFRFSVSSGSVFSEEKTATI